MLLSLLFLGCFDVFAYTCDASNCVVNSNLNDTDLLLKGNTGSPYTPSFLKITNYSNVVISNKIEINNGAFLSRLLIDSGSSIKGKSVFNNGGIIDNKGAFEAETLSNNRASYRGLFSNKGSARIDKINNSNADFKNIGELVTKELINSSRAIFENNSDAKIDKIKNIGDGTKYINNGDVIAKDLTNGLDALFENNSTAMIDRIKNEGGTFLNNSVLNSTTFRNSFNGTVTNRGTLDVERSINNAGSFNNYGTVISKFLINESTGRLKLLSGSNVNVDSIVNKLGGVIENDGNVSANIIHNMGNKLENKSGGAITSKIVNNTGNISNSGNFLVEENFNNEVNGKIDNSGSLSSKLLKNRGEFNTLSGSSTTINKIFNEGIGKFKNSGSVMSDSIYNASNDFNNEVNGRIISDNVNNSGRIVNQGDFTVSKSLNNSGIFTNDTASSVLNVASLNNLVSGVVNNKGNLTVSSVFENFGTINNDSNGNVTALKLLNEANGTFNNSGTLTVSDILRNRGLFKVFAGGIVNITTLNNDVGSKLNNDGNITAKTINNASNDFENEVNGRISAEDINNISKIKNEGEITLTKSLNNTGIFENLSGGTANIANINNNSGQFKNSGTVNSSSFINKSIVNNSSVLNSAKIQNEVGVFNNTANLSTNHLINSAEFNNLSSSANANITNLDNNANALFKNTGSLTISNNLTNKGIFDNDSGTVTVSQIVNDLGGTFFNNTTLNVSSALINHGRFRSLSSSNITSSSLINEIGGDFVNVGNITINTNLTNKSVFENNGFLNTANLSNELNGIFNNRSILMVTGELMNKNSFVNFISGNVTSGSFVNYHHYRNDGNINVSGQFVNSGNFETGNTSIINTGSRFENKNGAVFSNKGMLNTQDLINKGRFENSDGSFTTVSNIKNHNLANFINYGRVSVLNDFINDGNLSLTSDSRLSINGVYRQNGGVVNLTLNGYTTDSLITASQMFIKNNTILRLSSDPNFNLGVTQYVLMESNTEISFSDFDFERFKRNIDASGLGPNVKWKIYLSPDGKKLLLTIESVSLSPSTDPSQSILTESEKRLVEILSRFDTTKLKHPYLKSIIRKFQSNLTTDYEKKLLAQSLTYTPTNAVTYLVRKRYSSVAKKILSSLDSKITGRESDNGNISMNYLSSSDNNKYHAIKDMYSLKKDFALHYDNEHGTDLINIPSYENDISQNQPIVDGGDSTDGNVRIWADGIYSVDKNNKHSHFNSFRTEASGFITGVDKQFTKSYLMGLSLSAVSSDTKEQSFSINTSNANISLYGMSKFNRSYLTNILSYGFFKHVQGREKVGELLNSKYNTRGISFYAEYKYLLTSNFNVKTFTRFGLNKQSEIKEETKTGIGGLERNVQALTYNDFIVGYGMSYSNRIYSYNRLSIIPFASIDYEYNLSHKPLDVESYFVDMGYDYKFITNTDSNNLHNFSLSTGFSFARNDVKNPMILKFMYSLDISSGLSNLLSLKVIKSF